MGLSRLLFTDPGAFLILAIPLLYSIIAHEMAHGWVAYLFGDNTAKRMGRFSLNPVKHLDPIGTLALFLVGFGWAKPVSVDYRNLKNFRVALICVSFAGCLTNIIIATIAGFAMQFPAIYTNELPAKIFNAIFQINIILAALNLIPIPPLDGSKILMGLLPKEARIKFARIEPYGFPILMVLLFTGMLRPVIIFVGSIILLFIRLVLNVAG